MKLLEEFWYGNINPMEGPFQSQRKFDKIIRRAFKCGFSREMTIGLLDIEKKKGYNVPNLTTNSKQK